MATKTSQKVYKEMTDIIHAEICMQFMILAADNDKFKGGNWKQVQGFAKELGTSVSNALGQLIDTVQGEVNPSNEYPGAPVTMYYSEITGERIL